MEVTISDCSDFLIAEDYQNLQLVCHAKTTAVRL